MTEDGSRNGTPFQLSLPVFEGDVDELLRLVSQRKISTSDVHVSQLTGQFRTYLDASEEPDLDVTGEFVAASARILAIKSADLLVVEAPEDNEEAMDPVPRTADEALKEVSRVLRGREGLESFAPAVPPFSPEKNLQPWSPHLLVRAWNGLEQRTKTRVKRVAVPSFVRLEVALSGLIRMLRTRSRLSFKSLIKGASRNDAVVHFVAVLELVRRRQATASQEALDGDITLEWVEDGSGRAERAG